MTCFGRRTLLLGAVAALSGQGAVSLAAEPGAVRPTSPAMQAVLDYVQAQQTTGFLVIRDGETLVERNWPLPPGDTAFKRQFIYGANSAGELLEDVASQQKSFVAVLLTVAVDKGLLDLQRPVSAYIGAGWSKASPAQEAKIKVIDLMTMSSGLTTEFAYQAPPGAVFVYNTPVYAVTKQVLVAVARQPLDSVTHDWLTAPAGMADTAWRRRPAAFGDVGNPTGLVTSPRDVAKLGQIILDRGRAADGRRIVSQAGLEALFQRSAANPAYGRLWWLNGGGYSIRALGGRVDGPLIPSAPADVVAALGALDRKLYVSPSRRLIVVRLGQATPDKDFDDHLWGLLSKALEPDTGRG